jgi:methylase of polypeptide subunit release factors
MFLTHIGYPVYYILIKKIRSNRTIAEKLFGLQFPPNIRGQFWDFTTLALKQALRLYVHDQHKVLEIGVGRFGVLIGYVSKNWRVQASGVDIQEECVQGSRDVMGYNHLDQVRIWQSDLFDNVFEEFDVIFFNSVYIKTSFGEQYMTDCKREFWDGGETGYETIERFIHYAPRCMRSGSHLLLGVNDFYLPQCDIIKLSKGVPLSLENMVKPSANPSSVYVWTMPRV